MLFYSRIVPIHYKIMRCQHKHSCSLFTFRVVLFFSFASNVQDKRRRRRRSRRYRHECKQSGARDWLESSRGLFVHRGRPCPVQGLFVCRGRSACPPGVVCMRGVSVTHACSGTSTFHPSLCVTRFRGSLFVMNMTFIIFWDLFDSV